VSVLLKMETSTARHRVIKSLRRLKLLQCELHLGGGCNDGQDRQQDRQEHQGVDRGRLDEDGDIDIKTSSHQVSTETQTLAV
jgi:hypothetical protein